MEEQELAAYAQGYADAAGYFALAAGRESQQRYWVGYADGVEDGVGARHRSDPRRRGPRNLTRPGGRR